MTETITITRPGPATADEPPGPPPHPDMAWVPGGVFLMGSDRHYPEEAPTHHAGVDGFWMDCGPVTNAEFRAFVEDTGYVTTAERPPDPDDYPGADPARLVPASAVFTRPQTRTADWWSYVPGADWRHPRGPGSSLRRLDDHPVVHMTWADVSAFADWAGKAMPTEAEWEYAARGGLDGAEYAWGDELAPRGRYRANTWQGEFPVENLRLDGYEWTSPVGAFDPNGYGLHDMIGNVWEWTADWYAAHGTTPPSPQIRMPRKVIKGGSYLCAPNYCRRYRPAARLPLAVDTSTGHVGFRCVVRG